MIEAYTRWFKHIPEIMYVYRRNFLVVKRVKTILYVLTFPDFSLLCRTSESVVTLPMVPPSPSNSSVVVLPSELTFKNIQNFPYLNMGFQHHCVVSTLWNPSTVPWTRACNDRLLNLTRFSSLAYFGLDMFLKYSLKMSWRDHLRELLIFFLLSLEYFLFASRSV